MVVVNDEANKKLDAMQKFMYTVKYDEEIPPEVFIAFPNEEKDKLKKMWRASNDMQYAISVLTKEKELSMIGKPSKVSVSVTRNGIVYILHFNSIKVYATPNMFPIDDEKYNNEIIYVKCELSNGKIIASDIIPLIGTQREEMAKEILEHATKNDIDFEELIAIAYGYYPIYPITTLMMRRWLSTVRTPISALHQFELSPVNSGKTTFAVRNMFTYNWAYIDEVPSIPYLIMDAKDNSLGVVYRYDGVIIDEVDKYAGNLRQIVQPMLSGMSHGIWTRGKGSGNTPNIVRKIPVVMMGNITNAQANGVIDKNAKSIFARLLFNARLNESMVNALLDRIAINTVVITNVNSSDLITMKVIPDSIMRGIQKVVSDYVTNKYKDYNEYEGRKRIYYNIIKTFADNFTNYKDDIAKNIVEGVLI
jgi:hypothetical protein